MQTEPARELGPNDYRCADCGGIFQRVADSQADALAEAEQLWGVPNADTAPGMAEVCEDCFQDVRRRYPADTYAPAGMSPIGQLMAATLAARPAAAELRAIVGPEIVAEIEAAGMDLDVALAAAVEVATAQIVELFLRGSGIGAPIGIDAAAEEDTFAKGFTPGDIARLFKVPAAAIWGPTRAQRRREGARLVREEIARRRLAKLTA